MTMYSVPESDLRELLRKREGSSTFVPSETGKLAWVDAAGSEPSLSALAQPRAVQSLKGFLMPPAESVGLYGPGGATATALQDATQILVGVRACELRARNYLDKVMLEGVFDDPAYRAKRESATIISCDCVDCTDSCFCTLVGGRPFATEGYDANLTPIGDGYLLEVATDKGHQWVGQARLTEASPEQLNKRDKIRQNMASRLQEQNAKFTFSASDEVQPELPNEGDEVWQRFAADCVECGCCTNICPTCHCFYLYDQVLGAKEFERVRTWDSCLLSSYHRMAGGVQMKLTPRPKLLSRLANRVLHKFTYSPKQYGLLGCVGCGRCIDGCLGAIDIRQVVQELSK